MDVASAVSTVSEMNDDELVATLKQVERAYIHFMIEANLRGLDTAQHSQLLGVVKRLRTV